MSSKQTVFELRNTDDLIPYARNARTHSSEQIQKLMGSIKEFGFLNPVVISEDGGILAGHGRVMAAQKLGIKQVPCVVESHLTEAQKKAYILADNRLALDAGWDEEMLSVELKSLQDEYDFDLDLLGFSDEELKKFDIELSDLSESGSSGNSESDPDNEVVVDEAEPVTKEDDIWILGDHRLICGDSTNPDVVKSVMNGEKPNLMVTDPPYGVNLKPIGQKRKAVKGRIGLVTNDDNDSWYESYQLFQGNIAYVWHANTHQPVIMEDLKKCNFEITSVIIWNKNLHSIGFSDYQWKHEACIYATRGNHNWKGGRNQFTVWDIPNIICLTKDEGEWGHSTQKPIECMKRPIENNTDPGEWVYDPFCGSGTTIIAAEMTGRKCCACEIAPKYCDAICRRFESVTGKKAIRESDGVTFDELIEARDSDN